MEAENKNKGLYSKYEIRKIVKNPDYGKIVTAEFMGLDATPEFISVPCDPKAEYFVLRLDEYQNDENHRNACLFAVNAYANKIEKFIPKLAKDLREKYPSEKPLSTPTEKPFWENFDERFKSLYSGLSELHDEYGAKDFYFAVLRMQKHKEKSGYHFKNHINGN